MAGWLVAAAVLVAATAFGFVWRTRAGRLRPAAPADPAPGARWVDGRAAVTLLQFATPTCTPCRRLRELCGEIAAATPGVRHVEIDADRDLDVARAFGVWRVPTLVVLDRTGQVAWRAVGVPRRSELDAAVGGLVERQVA
jgi:thiol-disulfide isomerase/thioredoxin